MNVFENKRLYPDEQTPIKGHYKDNFEEIFIALIPFFRIQGDANKTSPQRMQRIIFEEFKKKLPDLKVPEFFAEIYSNENLEYPADEQILQFGVPVKWDEVRSKGSFESYAEIHKALRTAIGSYKTAFSRKDLADRLSHFAEEQNVFLPPEGTFDVISKTSILKAFRNLNKSILIVEDEFYEKKKVLDITDVSAQKFSEAIEFKDYYIYDKDKELLFAVSWDFYFYLICSSRENLNIILKDQDFEGFYCDDATELPWEHTAEEIRIGLEKEAR